MASGEGLQPSAGTSFVGGQPPQNAASTWVLRDHLSDRYFVRWTGIGPMQGTREEAAQFSSEQAAMQSPAYSFPLTFFKPEAVTSEAASNRA